MFQNKASSRDKALYYFNRINKSYKYLWFKKMYSYPVFTLKNIDEKYKNYDLLSASHKIIYKSKLNGIGN